LLTALLTGPFFAVCWTVSGSPFSVLDNHARFYDSHEHAGMPGFRSQEESLKNPYSGRKITVLKYIFSGRSVKDIFLMFIKGYVKTLTRGVRRILSMPFNLQIMIYPVWAGLCLMPFLKKGRPLLFWGLLFMLPHSFILNLHLVGESAVDIRLAASCLPLIAFAFAAFIYSAMRVFAPLAKKGIILKTSLFSVDKSAGK